jgi:ABC-type lipoprotein release transport system permease subunit|tara:strand:+ start:4849 stop:4977 length:129 start_codon:yes stop_codon:yes gene_type:complete
MGMIFYVGVVIGMLLVIIIIALINDIEESITNNVLKKLKRKK